MRYNIGGAEINEVTDALAVGISAADLKAMLVRFGVSDVGIEELLAKLDELGIGDTPQAATGTIDIKDDNGGVISAPAAEDTSRSAKGCKNDIQCAAGNICFEGLCIPIPVKAEGTVKWKNPPEKLSVPDQTEFVIVKLSQIVSQIKSAAPEERENLINELQSSREDFRANMQDLRQDIRKNAKELRDNFRENVKATIGHVDHGKTARIAIAHGRGLRMLNRFRSAAARFDHVLGRLESRIEKLEAQGIPTDSFFDIFIEIEVAKNMSVENEAKIEELKAKYESLLLGENAGGVAEEARAIAQELKEETRNLHAKLRDIADDIRQASKNYNSSKSNTSI